MYDYALCMITHELIHIDQYNKNTLDVDSDGYFMWKGKRHISYDEYLTYDYKSYVKLPWEKEAIKHQKSKYYELFYKSDAFLNLRGRDKILDYIIDSLS